LQTVTGAVTRHAEAYTYQIAYAGGLPSRITWFVPRMPVNGRFGIYHEGHGGPAVVIGAETIDWLLDRGWQVIAVDMPLIGMNGLDARPGLEAHGQFDSLDLGPISPLSLYLTPVRAIVDWIVQLNPAQDPELLLIGRSGGGWTAYTYGAVDPRIDIAVSVAGGRPISERLDAPWGAAELGDYEQTAPHLYNAVGHEHLMAAAGAKASMHFFNRWDGCCFRIQPESAFVQYLRGASSALGKHVSVFVDEQNGAHSIGPAGYVELDRFLAAVLPRVPRPPSPPRGFRIVTQ
jgi:dienelactone hydrolase